MRFLQKTIAFMAVLLVVASGAFAQRNFFKKVSAGAFLAKDAKTKNIRKADFNELNEQAMRQYLLAAPLEFKNNGVTLPLQIPLPDGAIEIFNMVESPVLSAAVAADHPEIKTYSGNGTANKKHVIRISFTSEGFNAIILNVKGSEGIYFEKLSGNIYVSYFTKDAAFPANHDKLGKTCGTPPLTEGQRKTRSSNLRPLPTIASTGTVLRTFRVAMAGNGEFTQNHGGTVAAGFAAIVGYVNRMKALYRNELSCDFTLVSGSSLVYADPLTDPFTGSDDIAMLGENQTLMDTEIGSANYDVGFVMGYNGPGYSPGGVAYFESLCNNSVKAGGVSQEGDFTYYSQLYSDKTLFHEMGHKFGMSHSYNSSIPVCTTREQETSVEPGSGATLMSYGFKCNDATGNDDYFESTTIGLILGFHSVNYNQAVNFLSTLTGGTSVATGNTPPVITMPPAYTIPKSTPFSLTGSAADADGDVLTYSWEGTNTGSIAAPSPTDFGNTAIAPFFRSYDPVSTPTRIYPLLDSILNGSNNSRGDKLPSVGVATTHSFTVRDNNAAGGGVSNASVTVTVNGAIGPFLITSNLSASYPALSTQTVTWSVNGTNAATPNVKITLSTDGGHTFPVTLAASTANDGNEVVTIPNNLTTTARIKVESIGNIFFDISNVDFTITEPVAVNHTITATSGANGTVTPAGATSVSNGGSQTYTIAANSCYQIADVLVDGVSQGAISTYTFSNVTAAHTISASFSSLDYTITATTGANGSISPSGATAVSCGGNQVYTIAANSCYQIADVLVDGVSQGAVSTYTFSNVTAAHTISASFSALDYTITATAGANGSISPSGTTAVSCGGNQVYTIAANSCYQIADVLVDGISQGAVSTYTFSNVTAAHSISASFSQSVSVNVSCPLSGNTNRNTNNNVCTYTVQGTEFNATATGACGDISLGYVLSGATTGNGTTLAGVAFSKGVTTVTWTAGSGANSASCNFTITVRDNQAPVITCPVSGNANRSTNAAGCTYKVTGSEFNATATDNCVVPSVSYTLSGATTGSGSGTLANKLFNTGVTTVSWKSGDGVNAYSTCSFTVTVSSTATVTCPVTGNVNRNTNNNVCTYTAQGSEFNATATCGATSLTYVLSGATTGNGTTLENAVFNKGVTTVTWTAGDGVNNYICSFTVTVKDNQAPVITCPVSGNTNRSANAAGCTYKVTGTEFNATATDNCIAPSVSYTLSGATTGSGSGTLANKLFNTGVTTVSWKSGDGVNAYSLCSFTVTVIGTVTVACPVSGNTNRNTNANTCTYTAQGSEFNATATCGVTSLTYALSGVTTGNGTTLANVVFNKGITTVTWTASDGVNNSVCSFTVTVRDNQLPVITCPVTGNTNRAANAAGCTYKVQGAELNAAGTDNCVTPYLTYTLSGATTGSGGTTLANKVFNSGVTTVTWTAKDGVTAPVSCSFTVTVNCALAKSGNNNIITGMKNTAAYLEVSAHPNPSANIFVVEVKSNNAKEKISMQVVDIYGQIKQTRTIYGNNTLSIGNEYKAGIYFVKFIQGNLQRQVKLVKASN